MKQKQKKKSRATKKMFSLFYRINGPGVVGFTGLINKATKAELPFIEAYSKTERKSG